MCSNLTLKYLGLYKTKYFPQKLFMKETFDGKVISI
jgi:hypothetical protein